MREISTLEVKVLVEELKKIEGYYIEKFYDLLNSNFRFKLTKNREQIILNCILCKTLNITNYTYKSEPESNFYIAIRKRISNMQIYKVSQINEDRIIVFEIGRNNEGKDMICYKIIFEMFGKGNLILTDADSKIILVYNRVEFKERAIKVGEIYLPPKSNGITISELKDSKDKIISLIKESPAEKIGSIVSRNINVGSLYSENAIRELGIDPKVKCLALTEKEIDLIVDNITKIEKRINSIKPVIYSKEGLPSEYSLYIIEKYKDLEIKEFGSLQELLDVFYNEMKKPEKEVDKSGIIAVENSIKKQKHIIENMENESEKSKKIGEYIFNNMGMINLVIETARRKGITKEEISKIFPDIKIKDLNLKDKTITIEIEEI